jgi:chromosomal replication initiation ATPase DnaA
MPTAPTALGTPHAHALLLDRPETTMDEVLKAVADHFKLTPCDLGRGGEHALARSLAVWLCRRHTTAKLGPLSRGLGYARPESIPGIVRRVEVWKGRDPKVGLHIRTLEAVLAARSNATEKVRI